VLFDDELAAQGDHEQYTQPSAKQGEDEDACVFEVEAQEDERRQGEDHTSGDRLAGIARGLNDVVLKNRCASERTQYADRQNRDWDGSGDGKASAETYVDGHCSEK
jgi:hypothetical protein